MQKSYSCDDLYIPNYKDSDNLTNYFVYSELLSDILSDNDNCLAKILVIQNLDK
jgi:hypothetical protein